MKQTTSFFEIMWLHFIKYFSAHYYFSPLMFIYFPHQILEHHQPMYKQWFKRLRFEESKTTGKMLYCLCDSLHVHRKGKKCPKILN
jgi:hypothetical protein